MSKNISILLNVILVIAVAILYYLHFSAIKLTGDSTSLNDSTSKAKPIVLAPKQIRSSKIVYVNLDVLNDKYDYIKDVNKSAKADQQNLENEYQTKAKKLQEDYATFQQKAQQGLLSENQASAEQESLLKRKDDLDQIELKSQSLMEKIQARTDEMNKEMKDYIKEYNKNSNYTYVFAYSAGPLSPLLFANDSMDITNDILDGLNEQYKAKKGKK